MEGDNLKEQFEELIHIALLKKATDIHFVYDYRTINATIRNDEGILPLYSSIINEKLFNYIKFISNLDMGLGKTSQSGSFPYVFNGQMIQFRFSLLSTPEKQTGVLRILYNYQNLTIDNLTENKVQTSIFHKWCQNTAGLIILSGATGSGKTTTLHALLHHISSKLKKRVVSLEDPIEILDHQYLQLQVNDSYGLTYEKGLKEVLRHDPDVIMVGEVRDPIVARLLVRIALSGHLVFTTIHAKNCIEVIYRLHEFGISYDDLQEILIGITSQKLIYTKRRERACLYEILEQDKIEYNIHKIRKS